MDWCRKRRWDKWPCCDGWDNLNMKATLSGRPQLSDTIMLVWLFLTLQFCGVIQNLALLLLWFVFMRGIKNPGIIIRQLTTQWISKADFRHEAKRSTLQYLRSMSLGHKLFSPGAQSTLRSMLDQENQLHLSILMGRWTLFLPNKIWNSGQGSMRTAYFLPVVYPFLHNWRYTGRIYQGLLG